MFCEFADYQLRWTGTTFPRILISVISGQSRHSENHIWKETWKQQHLGFAGAWRMSGCCSSLPRGYWSAGSCRGQRSSPQPFLIPGISLFSFSEPWGRHVQSSVWRCQQLPQPPTSSSLEILRNRCGLQFVPDHPLSHPLFFSLPLTLMTYSNFRLATGCRNNTLPRIVHQVPWWCKV